jgi:hypothetical protein
LQYSRIFPVVKSNEILQTDAPACGQPRTQVVRTGMRAELRPTKQYGRIEVTG